VAANLKPIVFDPARFETEIQAFEKLLQKQSLSETKDIQPFFRANLHLAAYIGTYSPELGPTTAYEFEYGLFGDYKPDLLLGKKEAGQFCVIEFEDGRPDSIFKREPGRSNPEWSSRFEHGFSQIVDWYYHLDDYKNTKNFARTFGQGEVGFTALLLIGRDSGLDDTRRNRLRWRTKKVLVDSQKVHCVTFDELHRVLRDRYFTYKAAAKIDSRKKK
jgi:hypothetical protein